MWDVPWFADLNDELDLPFFDTSEDRNLVNLGTSQQPEWIDISYWFHEYITAQGTGVPMWRAVQDRADIIGSYHESILCLAPRSWRSTTSIREHAFTTVRSRTLHRVSTVPGLTHRGLTTDPTVRADR